MRRYWRIVGWRARARGSRRHPAQGRRHALFVAVDDKPAGIIAVADPIKRPPWQRWTRYAVRNENRHVDRRQPNYGAGGRSEARITEVEADVLPDQKNAIVRRLKSEGRVVAMAGDGVNDAPRSPRPMSHRDGHRTDVAMQSAGLTLVKGTSPALRAAGLEPRHHAHIRETCARVRL